MRFQIHEVFDYEAHYRAMNLAEPVSADLLDSILDEAARFTTGELAPINLSGDEQGCTLKEGEVTTPDGFKEAYAKYIEGGWASLAGDPLYGGQGLPDSFSLFLEDLMSSANMAWTMYAGLSRGVIEALEHHGSDEQKQTFLTRLLTGEWTGTMCLTEPQAGSDVGLANTRAEPLADGAFAITGTKIFISAGEHDMAENIVHLVLARTADAPPGTRGISMFVVPKFDLDGTRNAVTCGAIEEKMGIHGNATCVLNFDEARGYLVGELNSGMRNMFTMMNAARVVVGLQGICQAQAALLKSTTYANERLQMRSISGPKEPDKPADPIIVHADVRRMLLTQKAIVDGGRALVYFTGQISDLASGLTGEAQQENQTLLDFLTPIVKGVLTELGFESVNCAMQIFGGHGYIHETGVEQHVRDARITMIYEGTTGIQGLDLLGRKILQLQGVGMMVFLARINETATALKACEPLAQLGEQLQASADEWATLSLSLGEKAAEDLDEVGAAAVDFLMYSGYVTLAYCWGRIALAANGALAAGTEDANFLEGKLATANFYFARMLPRTAVHKAAIEAGAPTLMAVSAEALSVS